MIALVSTLVQSQANKDAMLMKAILDRGSPAQGTNSLEVLREIRPFLGGGGGANELIKGIEIGRGLTPAALPPQQEEDLSSMLGGILKLMGPMQKAPEPQPAPAAAPVAPHAIPPWAYMGWMPPTTGAMSSEQMLRTALGDPGMREQLRNLLLEGSTMPTPKSAVPQPMPAVVPPVSIPVAPPPATPTHAAAVEVFPGAMFPQGDAPIDTSREITESEFQGLFQAMLPPDAYAALFQKKEDK